MNFWASSVWGFITLLAALMLGLLIANIIKRELKDVADSIEEDSMGNVIATKKGEKKSLAEEKFEANY